MTWKTYAPHWWALTLPTVPLRLRHVLEELSDLPGVQRVQVGRTRETHFIDVTLALHETAFMSEPFLHLCDSLDLREPIPTRSAIAIAPSVRTLREYQSEGVRWLVQNGGGVLGDEMGLGKTSSAIVAAETLRQSRDPHAPILIIGPKFVRDVWRRELAAVLGTDSFFACDKRKPVALDEFAMRDAKWWFCHYEILDGWRATITRPMAARRPNVVILDEAHWLRNPRAKRTKAALATATLAPARIVLTGTPIANKVTDLWPLLTLVNGTGSWGTSFSFAHRYTHQEKDTYGWVSRGTRNMNELHARMDNTYLRRTIEDVGGEIPALTREQFTVASEGTMPRELKKWCGGNVELALERFSDALASGNLGGETLEAITAWRKWTSETKLAHTVHLAASLLTEGEHVVIFTWQRETAEQIAQNIKDCLEDDVGFVDVVHGGIPQDTRDATVQSFQTTTAPCAIVATIDSLKEGVTLHRARRVIIHDLHWVPATLLQAEARIHRIGQTRPCLSTWMIVEDSVDSVIAKHLVSKAEVITAALDDTKAEDAFNQVGLATVDTSGEDFANRILEGAL